MSIVKVVLYIAKGHILGEAEDVESDRFCIESVDNDGTTERLIISTSDSKDEAYIKTRFTEVANASDKKLSLQDKQKIADSNFSDLKTGDANVIPVLIYDVTKEILEFSKQVSIGAVGAIIAGEYLYQKEIKSFSDKIDLVCINELFHNIKLNIFHWALRIQNFEPSGLDIKQVILQWRRARENVWRRSHSLSYDSYECNINILGYNSTGFIKIWTAPPNDMRMGQLYRLKLEGKFGGGDLFSFATPSKVYLLDKESLTRFFD